MNQPMISIIIPVYNTEKYLRQCLNSVVNQTYSDIEIICVNDGSTDTSPMILKEYADRDSRIKVITHKENLSLLIARITGLKNATGEHIWFVDSDDEISVYACEILVSRLKKCKTDILNFNAEVICESYEAYEGIKNLKRALAPYNGKLYGKDVFEGCFQKHLYGHTLCDKVFTKELCERAMVHIDIHRTTMGEDKYLFCILSFLADSYYGISDEYLYKYRVGVGITVTDYLSLQSFSEYMMLHEVDDAIERFLRANNVFDKYSSILTTGRKTSLISCVHAWINRLDSGDKSAGYSMMLKYWSVKEVVSVLAEVFCERKKSIALSLCGDEYVSKSTEKVKKIGVYYHRLSVGGLEKAAIELVKIWREMGYECVFITDVPQGDSDFDLPEGVKRVTVFPCFDIKDNDYSARIESWEKIIEENDIDTVVYHAWTSNCLLWDMLVIKGLRRNVIVHCHGIFSLPTSYLGDYFADMPSVFMLADAIVTIGLADYYFWNNFNKRTFRVINPISFNVGANELSSLRNRRIVWVGRFSSEKNPFDALEAFSLIYHMIGDVSLYMIGDSIDKKHSIPSMKKYAKNLGIENAVVFTGFTQDIKGYYTKSDLLLFTSNSEGFPLTLFEAKMCGLPCVMYELPYLVLTENNRGIVPVEMRNVRALAFAAMKVLKDDGYRFELGRQAREHALELSSFDYERAWKDIFDSMEHDTSNTIPDGVSLMWNTLLEHYKMGASVVDNTTKEKIRTGDRNILVISSSSGSYRIGRFITWIPRKIKGGICCCKEHGFTYTIKWGIKKLLRG